MPRKSSRYQNVVQILNRLLHKTNVQVRMRLINKFYSPPVFTSDCLGIIYCIHEN
jgi:hypothetical protein